MDFVLADFDDIDTVPLVRWAPMLSLGYPRYDKRLDGGNVSHPHRSFWKAYIRFCR